MADENEKLLRMVKDAKSKLDIMASKTTPDNQQRFDETSIAKEESYLENKTNDAKQGKTDHFFSYQGHNKLKTVEYEDENEDEYEFSDVEKEIEIEAELKEKNELEISDGKQVRALTNGTNLREKAQKPTAKKVSLNQNHEKNIDMTNRLYQEKNNQRESA